MTRYTIVTRQAPVRFYHKGKTRRFPVIYNTPEEANDAIQGAPLSAARIVPLGVGLDLVQDYFELLQKIRGWPRRILERIISPF